MKTVKLDPRNDDLIEYRLLPLLLLSIKNCIFSLKSSYPGPIIYTEILGILCLDFY